MKLALLLVILASSLSAYADVLVGLNCSTKYVIHEVRRTPYETSRVVIRNNILGGEGVLGYIPLNNGVNEFSEALSLNDINETIIYSLEVQSDTTILSINVKANDNEISLLKEYQFNTKEGLAKVIPLLGMVSIGSLHATNIFLTCLPIYR
jgi:hypothetical protein